MNSKVKFSYVKVLLLFIIVLYSASVFSQAPKLVIGYIYNKEEFEKNKKKNVPLDPSEVTVFLFNTVAEAQEVYKKFKNNEYSDDFLMINTVSPDYEGYYEARLPDNGALVIRYGLGEPVLEKIEGRSKIITYVEGGITLEGVSIIGNYTQVTSTPPVPEQYGNLIFIKNANVVLPIYKGKTNARMMVVPYVYNHNTGDTVHFRKPRLYYGEEFYDTQERYMGYDQNRDSLYKFASKEILDNKKNIYYWNDTVVLPNAKDNFQVLGKVYLQDYAGIYDIMDLTLSSRYARKPLKFLEYSVGAYSLDPYQYEEKAKKKLIVGSEDVSFKFEVGKSELDMSDPVNMEEVERLRQKLMGLVNNFDSKLKELRVTSISSPDGPYTLNRDLSIKRLKYAEKLIFSMIPADRMRMVYTYTENPARVATWSEFVDVLRKELEVASDNKALKDSLTQAITGIEEIIEKYPKSHDMQSAKISGLPLYRSFIVNYLPKLRSMKCEYKAEEFRELTPDEIYEKYMSDEDYRTGKKNMELYEYWNLFNIVKDKKELENLYRLAYDYSVRINPKKKPWILAANNLAESYIKRDTFDTNILMPLIDTKVASCNQVRTVGGAVEYINMEEIVANQLIMYVKTDDFANASIMAQILPKSEKYNELVAFAYCLGGYYRITGNLTPEEKVKRMEYFNLVRNSTPLNNVVMCLAMNNETYDSQALQALDKMPQDDAKVQYLKAVAYGRRGEAGFNDAMMALKTCFLLDKEYIPIAKTDGDIPEDLYETAYELYQLDYELMQMNN